MTDNEIIKALECCADEGLRCGECPCQNFKYSECYELITRESLDLINRQKAEISRAKDYIELLEIEKQALKEDSDKSKATAMGVIKRQDAEIKRLHSFETYRHCRAKAIKEFAERLDESLCKNIGPSRNLYWKISADIDNLVKEMVGDS